MFLAENTGSDKNLTEVLTLHTKPQKKVLALGKLIEPSYPKKYFSVLGHFDPLQGVFTATQGPNITC